MPRSSLRTAALLSLLGVALLPRAAWGQGGGEHSTGASHGADAGSGNTARAHDLDAGTGDAASQGADAGSGDEDDSAPAEDDDATASGDDSEAPEIPDAPSGAALRAELRTIEQHHRADIPDGTFVSVSYLIGLARRIDDGYPLQAAQWRLRVADYLASMRRGIDPFPRERGKITDRAYRSRLVPDPQGYAVYLPRDYDPSRPWPLYVALHGGSSNGNLFLGVVLGNNMSWLTYRQHLWDQYTPRWSPELIVVCPTGFGQVMWRFMGEQDVLDVIADVERHYNVDRNRVVLGGLSNGGVGAYALGLRHAWMFSTVQAMAGAPSWIQYAGGQPLPEEMLALRRMSGMDLAENEVDTNFLYYHGHLDGGPMKPAFVEAFTQRLHDLHLPAHVTWYNAGHDILYLAHEHGRIYQELAKIHRDTRPHEVRVVTGDYRAARQHWVTVTRITRYPELAHVRAVVQDDTVRVHTDNTRAFLLDLRDMPLAGRTDPKIVVDGDTAYDGPRAPLGTRIHLCHDGGHWHTGYPDDPEGVLVKKPGLAGPITDAYYGPMVHVYGTKNPAHTAALRHAAERGADGWPVWLWNFRQQVVADTAVTPKMMRQDHLVLYGTEGDNALLARMRDQLPIRVDGDSVVVGAHRYTGPDVGVRFIYPNPLSPSRYVVVQEGVTTDSVEAGNSLPDFLPDYLVYDHTTTRHRARLLTGPEAPLALGYFDAQWQLPEQPEGAGPDSGGPSTSTLPVPQAPPVPPIPAHYLAPARDPAGKVARAMAHRVATFHNYRAAIGGATWTVDPHAVWSVRPQARCLAALRRAHVPVRLDLSAPTPVATPVELLGRVGGVLFRSAHEDRPILLSCEMAARLPALARILAHHGVRVVDVISSYREKPFPSFHTMGLALDMARFWTAGGWLSVERDFVATPDRHTCQGPAPTDRRARTLREIACEMAASHLFASVLTPNYNAGHRNHFHIDARPDDPRLFLR